MTNIIKNLFLIDDNTQKDKIKNNQYNILIIANNSKSIESIEKVFYKHLNYFRYLFFKEEEMVKPFKEIHMSTKNNLIAILTDIDLKFNPNKDYIQLLNEDNDILFSVNIDKYKFKHWDRDTFLINDKNGLAIYIHKSPEITLELNIKD